MIAWLAMLARSSIAARSSALAAASAAVSSPLRLPLLLRQARSSSSAVCCSSSLRLPRSLPLPAAVPLRRMTTVSAVAVAAAAASSGDSSPPSSPSSSSKKTKKKPTKVLASDPEEVALRPAAPLAEFSVAGSSADDDASEFEGDLLVLGFFEEDLAKEEEEEGDGEGGEGSEDEEGEAPSKKLFPPSGPVPPCAFAAAGAAAVDASLSGLLTDLALDSEFSAKAGSSAFVRVPRTLASRNASNGSGNTEIRYRSVGLVGLGSKKQASTGDKMWGKSPFVALGSAVAAAAKQHKASTAGIAVFADGIEAEKAAEGIAKGLGIGAYESSRFKHAPAATRVSQAKLFFPGGGGSSSSSSSDALLAGAAKGNAVASGILLARYLVEAPPNVCTPRHLARAAEAIASSAPDVFSVEILGQKQCEEMNMGAFLGVAACSALEPQFIHLTYTPPGFKEEDGEKTNKDVALVGKGLTFDSGGYNLKVGGMIEMMKFDMGGAAAVLGAADALSKSKPATAGRVHIIVAACENMVDGKGMRPGDILTSAAGKTIEVNNTDAEGRLTLADALWYAQHKAKAAAVVDVATLTGACMVALGSGVAGLMATEDAAAEAVSAAARAGGEKVWRLPLEESYFEQLKSPVADMKNSGGRYGGAITAGLFLKQFIEEGVEWAHIDIAGPAWSDSEGGATGFGVSTLALWASQAGARIGSSE